MKVLFLDCSMGIAGDMFMAALYELLPEEKKKEFLLRMEAFQAAGVEVEPERTARCGISGTHMKVTIQGEEEDSRDVGSHEHAHGHHSHSHGHHHTHSHASLQEIQTLIQSLPVSQQVKTDASAVFRRIAEAESAVHQVPVEEIHFHEVGTKDAAADVVGACILMEMAAPDRVVASPVHTGFGQVHCAHGILPVPAPATAYLLKGVPASAGIVEGELCTPTGAALLTYFADEFSNAPEMKVEAIGYGMGKKEFAAANCVRAFLGTSEEEFHPVGNREQAESRACGGESAAELSCNLDDMTPEAMGYAMEVLFSHGALDVFTVPVGMKKNRPGVLLVCICEDRQAEEMANLILLHTTTLGVRRKECSRYRLKRKTEQVETEFGPVRVKTVFLPDGTKRTKPEYDDVASIARRTGLPFGVAAEKIYDRMRERE